MTNLFDFALHTIVIAWWKMTQYFASVDAIPPKCMILELNQISTKTHKRHVSSNVHSNKWTSLSITNVLSQWHLKNSIVYLRGFFFSDTL